MAEKIGIRLDRETLQLCDKYAAQHSRSRSEFIAAAIQKYVSDLELGKQKNIIARELAGEIVKGSEAGVAKISKGLFRYAVEVEIIIMILSELVNIPPEIMEKYRKEAIRNIRRTRGKINLDDLISRNRREGFENYAYRRRHLYNLNLVIVDGIRYNVMSVTPIHTEKTPKKVKELLKYLIDGK